MYGVRHHSMRVVLLLLGLVLWPFMFLWERVILRRPPVPTDFWRLAAHFGNHGHYFYVRASTEPLPGVEASAFFSLAAPPGASCVVTVFRAPTAAVAAEQAELARTNSLLTHVAANGRYIMACTFVPPDDELASSVQRAFLAFPVPGDA
jgi:hypothetical protein